MVPQLFVLGDHHSARSLCRDVAPLSLVLVHSFAHELNLRTRSASCLLSTREPMILTVGRLKGSPQLGVQAHTCNPSTPGG